MIFLIFPISWDDDPIWRTPSFFRGIGIPPISYIPNIQVVQLRSFFELKNNIVNWIWVTFSDLDPYQRILAFRVPKSLGWRGFKIIFFMIYLWFEYDFHLWFFYGFKLWLWFFYGLDMFFLWFWIWFFYDFFMVFLVLRIWFSAKNSRNFRFFYDFARVFFPQSLFSRKFDFGSKIVKKS